MTKRIFIIAEAGVNHNGDLDTALALVDAAAAAGADAVKFQTFSAARLASPFAQQAAYQARNTGAEESQLTMLKRLELDVGAHERLIARCRERSIQFLSSPFDAGSLDLLAHRFDLPTIKLGSGELTNGPLLLAAARTEKPLILSTGMATLGEVEEALGVLAFGYAEPVAEPTGRAAFRTAYADPVNREALKEKVTLLHCTTEYPAAFEDVNLRALDTLQAAFGLRVGYSDHTPGIAVAVAAAACGATVLEKHFTLDRSMPGPDHRASLEPDELAAMVTAVRQVEAALGDGRKTPRPAEIRNVAAARKSLVAARDIAAGTDLKAADVAIMRPGDGRSPMDFWDVLGTPAPRTCRAGEPL